MSKKDTAIQMYWNLMRKAIARSKDRKAVKAIIYKEVHHIIPRAVGGTNDRWNKVCLTVREHIIAHKLLQRVGITGGTTSDDESSVILAAVRVLYNHKKIFKMFGEHENDMNSIFNGIHDKKEAQKLFKKLIKTRIVKVDKSLL